MADGLGTGFVKELIMTKRIMDGIYFWVVF